MTLCTRVLYCSTCSSSSVAGFLWKLLPSLHIASSPAVDPCWSSKALCVEGWSSGDLVLECVWYAAASLLENRTAIQDTRSCFFTKHILFSRCLGLGRSVKCTLQCHSRPSSQLIAASDLLCWSFPVAAFHFVALMLQVFGKWYFMF